MHDPTWSLKNKVKNILIQLHLISKFFFFIIENGYAHGYFLYLRAQIKEDGK